MERILTLLATLAAVLVSAGPAVAAPSGDGLLRIGTTLFAMQNRQGSLAVLRLNRSGTRARPVTRVTDPRLQIPTAIAPFRDRLHLPNARFDVTPTPTTPYTAVAIPRPTIGGND